MHTRTITAPIKAADLLDAISAARDDIGTFRGPTRIRLTPAQFEELKASPLCEGLTTASDCSIYGLPFIVASDDELRAELQECLAELRYAHRAGLQYQHPALIALTLRAYDLKRLLGEL